MRVSDRNVSFLSLFEQKLHLKSPSNEMYVYFCDFAICERFQIKLGSSSVSVAAPVMVAGTGRTRRGIVARWTPWGAGRTWGSVPEVGRMRPRRVVEARMRMVRIPVEMAFKL